MVCPLKAITTREVGEVEKFAPGVPVVVRCTSSEKDDVKLEAKIYQVRCQ